VRRKRAAIAWYPATHAMVAFSRSSPFGCLLVFLASCAAPNESTTGADESSQGEEASDGQSEEEAGSAEASSGDDQAGEETGSSSESEGGSTSGSMSEDGTSSTTTGEASSTTSDEDDSAEETSEDSGEEASSGDEETGGSTNPVCPGGMSYGDPLAGMGDVVEIGPPTEPPANYFAFIEGPVWIGSLGTLFFSDNAASPAERIFSLVPDSPVELFLEDSGSNGLAVDNEDNLILADQRRQRIVRVDPMTGDEIDELAPPGSYRPNDLVMRTDGSLYFTDPDSGFYWISPDGTLDGPYDAVSRPNGTVLSLDENTLLVGDVGNRQVHRFPVGSDGAVDVDAGTIFVTAMNQTVDGMAVDCAGNLYVGTASGVEVYDPQAAYIGTVPTGESSNATFGGADRRTLYVTSRSVLKAVELAIPGLPN